MHYENIGNTKTAEHLCLNRYTFLSCLHRISASYSMWIPSEVSCENEDSRLVNIDQGPVRGYKEAEYGIYSFYGIPYANVPKGMDRFKAPLPPPEWKDPYEAVDKEIICPQANSTGLIHKSGRVQEQEDCLVASSNLPVWPPVHADWSPHMSLNQTFELRGSLLKERAIFWEDIYNKYYYNALSANPHTDP
ncbi:jg27435 [Pararge aegeria aegeria]|uniref:Jg27435 protein n=1 Tax=Pararge aegeria aegeria TaxID=348720 RepID=A0A8S4R3Y7_9NEOP|nr:jg27435 [Pararge aegeria aegeria]